MCLFRLFFYEKYDWNNHSMIKCKFKKVNNWTTTTYAPMGAFDYTTNGVTMHAHSCMTPADKDQLIWVNIITWHRTEDKPLSESIAPNLLTHICVPRSGTTPVSGTFRNWGSPPDLGTPYLDRGAPKLSCWLCRLQFARNFNHKVNNFTIALELPARLIIHFE